MNKNANNYTIKDCYLFCDKYDFSHVDFSDKTSIINTLVCYIKNIDLNKFYLLKLKITLSDNEFDLFKSYIKKIVEDRIPIQYLTNLVYFYKEQYYVNEAVLVPRQDTEILVENALSCIAEFNSVSLLDMCCGSGAVGISITKNSHNIVNETTFCDISIDALSVAKINVSKNNIESKVQIVCSDLFNNIRNNKKFDVIVSNPPYIETQVIDGLSDYVKKEPMLALNGGKDGLDVYRRIISDAKDHMNGNAYLLLEIGYNQKDNVCDIIKKYNEYEIIKTVKDLNSNDRVIVCRFHKI